MSVTLAEEAAAAARETLLRCVSPAGLRASADERGYRQVWTRDAMVSLLGVCAAGLSELVPAIRASLVSLADAQTPLGYVPIFVEDGPESGQGDPGGIDGSLWFIIGHHVLHRAFGAVDLLERHRTSLARAMLWARYQDSDDDGLIEAQEAAGWADLLAERGKTLYANVLYVLALRAYADLAQEIELPDAQPCALAAERAVGRLNLIHWVDAPLGLGLPSGAEWTSGNPPETRRVLQLTGVQLWNRPYYLPWVGFRDFGDWCDVLGNILAILAGVADPGRRSMILDYLADVGAAEPLPAKAIYPPITAADPDWRSYYRNGNLNVPHHYHNGGAWPFIGGLLIAALVADSRQEEAEQYLERLTVAARDGGWMFHEWHHGLTGRPMGKPHQAWSAAMLLYAQRAVASGHAAGFAALSGGRLS
jgi:glycogen debranching enzyme